jgi:ribosomal protein L40E
MSAILIAVLSVAAISLALYPLFEMQRRPARAATTIDPNLENLLSAREATYSAIKDLETDHAMGKLSDTDYTALRAKYEGKALAILQQLDAVQATFQTTLRAAVPDGTPLAPPATPQVCAQCGTPIATGAKFCRGCGASVATTCTSCGAPVAADSKFCRRCGSPVAALQPA